MSQSSPSQPDLLQLNDLWERVRSQTQHALTCGALQPIPTHYEWVECGGINFLVRIVANLIRKDKDRAQQAQKEAEGKPANPFLPYDDDLCVGYLSENHVCLLNKFNVVDHHLLIITRDFEIQESWLTAADFAALGSCMAVVNGLGFYNAGEPAGASQPHKHLQIVPLPMAIEVDIPIAPMIGAALEKQDGAIVAAPFPFQHGIARLTDVDWHSDTVGQILCDRYLALAQHLGLLDTPQPTTPTSPPYNLLVTRQWMIMVPRSRSSYEGIPVNSLGFAGALLARDADQLAHLKTLQPMTILTHVGC
jgi:ATP adenylyltransferase